MPRLREDDPMRNDEKPLLALMETGEVAVVPVAIVPDAPDNTMLLALHAAVIAASKAVGNRGELARRLGLSPQAVYLWQKIPAERVIEVERLTGVRRQILRPDLFQRPALVEALEVITAAGYRAVKPRKPKRFKRGKGHVGPTFTATFVDGTITRMTTFSPLELEKLDWDRGVRLSQAAYRSRWRAVAAIPPAIVSAHFERNGEVLARREFASDDLSALSNKLGAERWPQEDRHHSHE
jgi:DNA-binding transcriptional regulator YdaS (Cro superfamily)